MEAFFARIERRLPVERALAETKRAFAEGEYGERLRKPAYWAPFVLYGT
jgi:CHAT domain-containing protein